jgi:mannose-6-phosphate isomerase
MPWGGARLARWLGLPESSQPIGEAWLASDHHLHASRITNVPDQTITLRYLMTHWPDVIAGYSAHRFPLLIKIIEARQNLSIQVHPDDHAAKQWAPQEGGKTEAWLVLETAPEGKIYLGLRPGVTRDVLAQHLPSGTIPELLNIYTPVPGECYYVPAGTVHALGAGVCVLEVQQTSDATFRLYDWGRLDAQGKPRPLHIEAALAVLHEHSADAGPQTPVLIDPNCEQLVSCPYFTIYRLNISEQQTLYGPSILVPLTSHAVVTTNSLAVPVPFGHAVLIPAILRDVYVRCSAPGQMIWITWPKPRSGAA